MQLPIGTKVVEAPINVKKARDVRPASSRRASKYTEKVMRFISQGRVKQGAEIEITRFANRKLYMPAIGSYISYINVAQLIMAGYIPKVTYTRTKMDLTGPVLHHVLDQLGGLDEAELRGLIIKAFAKKNYLRGVEL